MFSNEGREDVIGETFGDPALNRTNLTVAFKDSSFGGGGTQSAQSGLGSISKNPTGTYTPSVVRTSFDKEDFFSDEKQSGINAGNRVKIYQLPVDIKNYNKVCRKLIGQGGTFCIKEGCTRSHRGAGEANTSPGTFYVKTRTNDSVFIEPSVTSNKLTEEVIEVWEASRYTLDEWAAKFSIANENSEPPLNSQILEDTENVKNYIKITKTPLKVPRDPIDKDDLTLFEASPYKRKFDDEDSFLNSDLNISVIKDFFLHVESGLESLSTAYVDTAGDVRIVKATIEKDHRTLLSRIQDIEGMLGKRPRMDTKYQAPTIWGSVSLVAETLENLESMFNDFVSNIDTFNKNFKATINSEHNASMDTLFDRITKIRDNLIESFKAFDERFRHSNNNISSLSQNMEDIRRFCVHMQRSPGFSTHIHQRDVTY